MANLAWMRLPKAVLLLVLISGWNASVHAGPKEFRTTDLGQVTVSAINDLGQVVGQSWGSAGNPSSAPFVWSAGSGFVPLTGATPDFSGGLSYPLAHGINNKGEITGVQFPTVEPPHPIVWTRPDSITYLPTYGSGTDAIAINQSGTVVGGWGVGHDGGGIVYTKDKAGNYGYGSLLPSLPWACVFPNCYGSNGAATGVNDANVVVGWSNTVRDQVPVGEVLPFPPVNHALLWHVVPTEPSPSVSEWQDLGTLPGTSNSEAHAINNKDVVVGDSDKHAFSWTAASGIVPLDTPAEDSSSASALNEKNWIVGNLSGPKGKRAVLWLPNSRVIDLKLLADLSHSDFSSLTSATDINELDQIIGAGLAFDGSTHAFLLTPIPEAPSFLVMLIGLVGVARATRFATAKQ